MLANELLQCYKEGKRARQDKGGVAGNSESSIHVARYSVATGSHKVELADSAEVNSALNGPVLGVRQSPNIRGLGGATFYGKRSKSTQWHALLKQIAIANKNFILAEEEARQQRLTRTAIWQTFPRQEMAFTFCNAHGKKNDLGDQLAIFTFEDASSGKRRFLVTTPGVFWQRYQHMLPTHQHYYEIVREGEPCHLYFDLEYAKAANFFANHEVIMAALLQLLDEALRSQLGLSLVEDVLVELDSSTDDKFSRHLIVPLPGHAFKNNVHVGAFVKKFCCHLRALTNSNATCAPLFVRKAGEAAEHPCSLVIDEAVYTRNRAFRLPYSCKFGKTARLLPTHRFKCKNLSAREVFFASLVCPPDRFDESILLTTFDENEVGVRKPAKASAVMTASHSREHSPYPAVDAFIQNIASVGETPARVRNWSLFAERGVLVFNIDHNRFCECVARQHKSNNVMYVVDFLLAGYYQKCHDPDCRDFRFTIRPLPHHLLPEAFRRSQADQTHGSGNGPGALNGQQEHSAATGLHKSPCDEAPSEWWAKVGEIASVMEDLDKWD